MIRSPLPEPEGTGLILSIDTAGPACQAVVSDGANVISERSVAMLRGHGEALIPLVEDVLGEASVTYEDLDRIAVTVGPGSFTGMRVGLAAARSFSATLNVPVVGIGTLEALAATDKLAKPHDAVRCVAIDARNGLVYGQRFDRQGKPMEAPAVIADIVFASSVPEGARLVGPATSVIAALVRSASRHVTLGDTSHVPTPMALAQLAASSDVGDKPKPLYLKPADAIAAKPAGLRVGSSTDSV